MRLRHQHRILKLLRRRDPFNGFVKSAIQKHHCLGTSLETTLFAILHDRSVGHLARGRAAQLLTSVGIDTVTPLLRVFTSETEFQELYETALAIEETNNQRFVPHLAHTLLSDPNPHRRQAAARALGWIRPRSAQAARALARCLSDPTQPLPAREEAAESLAYVGNNSSIPTLIEALRDPDPRIRFWSTFGLGQSHRGEPHAIAALESVLNDEAIPPGNWWSVGKEALAMLAGWRHPIPAYEARLNEETARILADPNSSPEDRRWAEGYSRDSLQ